MHHPRPPPRQASAAHNALVSTETFGEETSTSRQLQTLLHRKILTEKPWFLVNFVQQISNVVFKLPVVTLVPPETYPLVDHVCCLTRQTCTRTTQFNRI